MICSPRPRLAWVHSADDWQELDPVVERYLIAAVRLLFRADAAFAKPEIYEYLEAVHLPVVPLGVGNRIPAAAGRWSRLPLGPEPRSAAVLLGNFLRRLAVLEEMKHWSLTSLQTRMIKTGARRPVV